MTESYDRITSWLASKGMDWEDIENSQDIQDKISKALSIAESRGLDLDSNKGRSFQDIVEQKGDELKEIVEAVTIEKERYVSDKIDDVSYQENAAERLEELRKVYEDVDENTKNKIDKRINQAMEQVSQRENKRAELNEQVVKEVVDAIRVTGKPPNNMTVSKYHWMTDQQKDVLREEMRRYKEANK